MTVDRVLLAEPRGFCAGVEMAVKALSWMVETFEPPVYCFHEIVHNAAVVDRFVTRGVVFVDDIAEVPDGAPIMLSAHGSAPEVVAHARRVGGVAVNAVCPLVTKVHHEMKMRAKKGYTVIYVGHAGHEEAVGTMAVAPNSVVLAETPAEVAAMAPISGPVAVLTQTTLAESEWLGVKDAVVERYPDVWMPGRSDLCFATTNRQAAVRAIAPKADHFIVIGSDNSSNTRALAKVAQTSGCTSVHRINSATEIPSGLSGVVAVTAGASAPEDLVASVIAALAPANGVEHVEVIEEDEYFPPPREMRELQRGLAQLLGAALGAPAFS